jgi:hypothetical protein
MTKSLTIQLGFACNKVGVSFEGGRAVAIGQFLFDKWRKEAADGPVRFKLVETPEGFELWDQGKKVFSNPCQAEAAEYLQAKATQALLENGQGGIILHAACLSGGDRAMILPAQSGSGKTTLSAWLACRGYSFLADDVVMLPWDQQRVVPLTRPLQLKGESRAVLSPYFDCQAHQAKLYQNDRFCLIPPGLLGQPPQVRHPRLALLVFPKYEAGSPFKLSALSPANTGLALMECLVNARNLPGHGFSQAVKYAAQTPARSLVYSDF